MATIVIFGKANIVGDGAMWSEGGACRWVIEGHEAVTKWVKVVAVGVKYSVDLFVGSEVPIDSGAAEHIEGKEEWGDDCFDLSHGERWVTGSKSGDVMTLEGLDGSFGIVGSVIIGRYEGTRDAAASKVCNEGLGHCVVGYFMGRHQSAFSTGSSEDGDAGKVGGVVRGC